MNQDEEYLRLLSIFHYVVAGIAALFSMLPLIHLFLGIAMITGSLPGGKPEDAMGAMMGWFFVVIATAIITCGLAFAACLAVAGRSLAERRRYTFCLVVAGLSCMFTPFGTVLGVFTFVVLLRPPVRALFQPAAAATPAA